MSDLSLAERRRMNLRAWMDEKRLNQTDVATRIEKGRAYVSNLFLPERAFGEKAARYIESKLFMPTGWLDSDHSRPEAVAAWSKVSDLPAGVFALVPRVDVRVKRLFRRLGGSLLLKSDNSHFPEEMVRPDEMSQVQVLGRVLWRSG